ncbi:MAG: AMP-binding protein [Comamonas sp.]|uniref:AMP-binding protein n=1 Tax=Comamonas sp. TaxID=34028 RepID=UPI002FCB23A2
MKALQTSYWPADTSQPILSLTAGDALRLAAAEAPDVTALVELVPAGMTSLVGANRTDRRWTYAQLLTEAERCAHWLAQHFRPGERICLWAPNVPEWVFIQYGAAMAGLVLVTANPALRAKELRYVLRQSEAAGLIHTEEFRGTPMGDIARELEAEVRHRFCIADWRNLLEKNASSDTVLPIVRPEDPAQIQYTSGTTGEPKGAMLRHLSLVTNGYYIASKAGLKRGVFVSPMPLFHTSGSGMSALGCVTTRSTYVLPLVFDPELILSAIEREAGTLTLGVPTMLIAMHEQASRSSYDLSSLRTAICGGAPIPGDLLKRVETSLGCDLTPVFGQTELSPIVMQCAPDDSLEDKANSAGRPLWQVEVKIGDPAKGDPVPIGDEGEIMARGYQCMLGYYNMPEANAQAIDAENWVRTGDLGIMDERGYVRVTGRLKDMIIRGGENIYPPEIEQQLFSHPGVADVAVFGIPDPYWGEVVVAAVRASDLQSIPTVSELHAHCRAGLAPHKTPTHWFLCREFPLTGSGKVQKFKLRELWRQGSLVALV